MYASCEQGHSGPLRYLPGTTLPHLPAYHILFTFSPPREKKAPRCLLRAAPLRVCARLPAAGATRDLPRQVHSFLTKYWRACETGARALKGSTHHNVGRWLPRCYFPIHSHAGPLVGHIRLLHITPHCHILPLPLAHTHTTHTHHTFLYTLPLYPFIYTPFVYTLHTHPIQVYFRTIIVYGPACLDPDNCAPLTLYKTLHCPSSLPATLSRWLSPGLPSLDCHRLMPLHTQAPATLPVANAHATYTPPPLHLPPAHYLHYTYHTALIGEQRDTCTTAREWFVGRR